MPNQSALMYDEFCSMCRWYSQRMVDFGLIAREERKSVQVCMADNEMPLIDFNQAMNKIAYYNADKNQIFYGIDSILEIISHKYPRLVNVFRWKPIIFLLNIFYNLISYNRRIIAPTRMCNDESCTPTRSWSNRILYIIVCWMMVVAIAKVFSTIPLQVSFRWPFVYIEGLTFIGQFIIQGIVLWVIGRRYYYDYFGHLAHVSLIGSLYLFCLFLGLKLMYFLEMPITTPAIVSLIIVQSIMFFKHRQRVKSHNFPLILIFTWLLYRAVVVWSVLN